VVRGYCTGTSAHASIHPGTHAGFHASNHGSSKHNHAGTDHNHDGIHHNHIGTDPATHAGAHLGTCTGGVLLQWGAL